MAYKQLKPFYPADMGTKKGWCLENVARGYHIYGVPSAQPSAKADMEFNKARGTLHPLNTLPTNVAVPVYLDTASKYVSKPGQLGRPWQANTSEVVFFDTVIVATKWADGAYDEMFRVQAKYYVEGGEEDGEERKEA